MDTKPIVYTEKLNLHYGNFHALKDVNIRITPRSVTSIIGPSGCGKSTLLRVFNRMNDLVEGVRITGSVVLEEKNIYDPSVDLLHLRRKVGMVFQRPNPFPLSIIDNIVFGLHIHHVPVKNKTELDAIVQKSLESVLLWDDLKDKLSRLGTNLSLEQQQRLCIARTLVVKPDILLMDEPCSALDPISTARIEEMMQELKKDYTIIIVTHNMQQAARVSDEAGYMLLGELIEFDKTQKIFTSPNDKRTEEYITGRLG